MTRSLRTILTQVGSFVLAGLLLFLALRGLDVQDVGSALRGANYLWLVPMIVSLLASHWLRAWRWTMLIEALPEATPTSRPRVRVGDAFGALMIGYLVNYVAPRLGEVVRTANLATRRKLAFSSLFGTVVVERILDVLTLGLGLLSVVFLLRAQMTDLYDVFVSPLFQQLGAVPLLLTLLGTIVLAVAVFFVLRSYLRASTRATALWRQRVRPAAASFKSGMLTVIRSRRRTGLIVSTLAIWFCYAVAAHLPFVLLNMTGPFQITLLDSWCIMLLGAIGVALPSPGGTGTYHFITILVLTSFFGVAHAESATYAVLTHAAQLVLYAIVGFIVLIVQGSSIRRVTKQAADARGKTLDVETANQ